MRHLRLLTLLLAVGFPVSANAAIIDIASGVLSIPGGGLISGPGGWSQATLSYDVNFDQADNHFIYTYTFTGTVPLKNVSHVITEVSFNFTEEELLAGTTAGGDLDSYSASTQGNSNPGMPYEITGVKWNPTGDSTSFTWTIETLRAPMWGNIYVVDGKGNPQTGETAVYSYNSGFALSPPPDCYRDLFSDTPTCSGFALVPDTVGFSCPDCPEELVTPEPASIALMGTGLTAIAVRLRRRRAAKARAEAEKV
jgi:hypothetical protein